MIGIGRLPIKESAAAIVEAIGHAGDPLNPFSFAAISSSARIRLASAFFPVPMGVLRMDNNWFLV